MAGVLTVSETLDGTAVADTLAGGGTGVDLGSIQNGSFAPITDKTANTGKQDLYIRHDGTASITNMKAFIQEFGTSTGFTYGGADSPANDFTNIKSLGSSSGGSKNNADGLSGGLWMEMDFDVSNASRFDQATRPSLVKIFGDNGTDGQDLASGFTIAADSMVYDASGTETAGSSPVAGEVGASGDTVKGDNTHLQFRIFRPTTDTSLSGVVQFELVFSYAFTV